MQLLLLQTPRSEGRKTKDTAATTTTAEKELKMAVLRWILLTLVTLTVRTIILYLLPLPHSSESQKLALDAVVVGALIPVMLVVDELLWRRWLAPLWDEVLQMLHLVALFLTAHIFWSLGRASVNDFRTSPGKDASFWTALVLLAVLVFVTFREVYLKVHGSFGIRPRIRSSSNSGFFLVYLLLLLFLFGLALFVIYDGRFDQLRVPMLALNSYVALYTCHVLYGDN